MIWTITLLSVICLAVVALAVALRRGAGSGSDARKAILELASQLPAEDCYRPMARLFAREDLEFLRVQRGYSRGLERRLRRERRRVLGLYLREVRTDFRRVWSFCRALIPMSRNPEFGSLVMQQFVVFYGLYTALRLRCLLGTFVYVRADTVDLVASLQRLQQGARAVVESLGPGFQPAYSGVR